MSDTLTRRKWLTSLVPRAADAVARTVEERVERNFAPQRRPPGAAGEALFLALCTRCGKCSEACPHQAIHVFKPGTGMLANTPVMLPDQRACHMCDGFPCAAACDEGALQVPQEPTWRLGRVRIDETRCIAYMGPECGACIDACPGETQALSLSMWRPRLDPEQCVGCGLCIERCPTSPPALVLEALRRDTDV